MEGIVTTAIPERWQRLLTSGSLLEAGDDFLDGAGVGAMLHAKGMPEAALAVFEAVVTREPGNLAVWHAVATLRFQLDRPHSALLACNAALEIAPDDLSTLFNTAVVLAAMGDAAAALHCYGRVLDEDPAHRGTLLNRPTVLAANGYLREALMAAQSALEIRPDDADFAFNLGEILMTTGQFVEARAAYLKACELRPLEVRFAISAAVSLAACGEVVTARDDLSRLKAQYPADFAAFRTPLKTDALAAFPEIEAGRIALIAAYQAYRSCDWSQRNSFIDLYRRLAEGKEGGAIDNPDLPFLSIALPLPGETRLLLAQNVAKRIGTSVSGQKLVRRNSVRKDRLRIGYLSGDFRQHATAYLMSRLPGLHDRERFEVFLYSSGPADESAMRAEIIAGADAFCEVGHFDAVATAQRIAYDGIDILVDLSGYVLYARSASFALRAAPVQVSYLTYLQTSGASWIDYTLLDRNVLTVVERPYWQEKIGYLPSTFYLCDDRKPLVREFELRSKHGLPEDLVVFCCLNSPWKIDPETFKCWMTILHRVPESVLWLYDDTMHSSDRLCREALIAGIDPSRLIFAIRLPHAEHLARFHCADVFLDTFSCNAHTTCVEAMTAGLPVVTLPGDTVVQRVASSLLTAHGFTELIASNSDVYVELACRLALDRPWRKQLRKEFEHTAGSALFCTERRVREIERAFEMMWKRHSLGLPPADFDVPPLDD